MNTKHRLSLLRECGQCKSCCTTQLVEEIEKPADTMCKHLNIHPNEKGCLIYKDRPKACEQWMCVWRSGSPILSGSERPDFLGVVFDTVVREDISFLVGVASEPDDVDNCLAAAKKTVHRLAEKHLVVLQRPGGFQSVFGPDDKVELYRRLYREG